MAQNLASCAQIAFDYKALNTWRKDGLTDINLRKGENVFILEPPQGGWVKVRLERDGSVGYAPESYIRAIELRPVASIQTNRVPPNPPSGGSQTLRPSNAPIPQQRTNTMHNPPPAQLGTSFMQFPAAPQPHSAPHSQPPAQHFAGNYMAPPLQPTRTYEDSHSAHDHRNQVRQQFASIPDPRAQRVPPPPPGQTGGQPTRQEESNFAKSATVGTNDMLKALNGVQLRKKVTPDEDRASTIKNKSFEDEEKRDFPKLKPTPAPRKTVQPDEEESKPEMPKLKSVPKKEEEPEMPKLKPTPASRKTPQPEEDNKPEMPKLKSTGQIKHQIKDEEETKQEKPVKLKPTPRKTVQPEEDENKIEMPKLKSVPKKEEEPETPKLKPTPVPRKTVQPEEENKIEMPKLKSVPKKEEEPEQPKLKPVPVPRKTLQPEEEEPKPEMPKLKPTPVPRKTVQPEEDDKPEMPKLKSIPKKEEEPETPKLKPTPVPRKTPQPEEESKVEIPKLKPIPKKEEEPEPPKLKPTPIPRKTPQPEEEDTKLKPVPKKEEEEPIKQKPVPVPRKTLQPEEENKIEMPKLKSVPKKEDFSEPKKTPQPEEREERPVLKTVPKPIEERSNSVPNFKKTEGVVKPQAIDLQSVKLKSTPKREENPTPVPRTLPKPEEKTEVEKPVPEKPAVPAQRFTPTQSVDFSKSSPQLKPVTKREEEKAPEAVTPIVSKPVPKPPHKKITPTPEPPVEEPFEEKSSIPPPTTSFQIDLDDLDFDFFDTSTTKPKAPAQPKSVPAEEPSRTFSVPDSKPATSVPDAKPYSMPDSKPATIAPRRPAPPRPKDPPAPVATEPEPEPEVEAAPEPSPPSPPMPQPKSIPKSKSDKLFAAASRKPSGFLSTSNDSYPSTSATLPGESDFEQQSKLTKASSLNEVDRRKRKQTRNSSYGAVKISSSLDLGSSSSPQTSRATLATDVYEGSIGEIQQSIREAREKQNSALSFIPGSSPTSLPGAEFESMIGRRVKEPDSRANLMASIATQASKLSKTDSSDNSPISSSSSFNSSSSYSELKSSSSKSFSDEELSNEGYVLTEHKGKKMIKGAKLEKLVEQLYSQSNIGTDFLTEYVDTFLLTYRTFTNAKELFSMLSASYLNVHNSNDEEKTKAKKLRICNFLKRWMEMHYYDFEGDLELFGEYDNFTNRLAQTGNDDVVVNVLKKAVSKGQGKRISYNKKSFTNPPPKPILPKALNVYDIETIELARQLTLVEFDHFSKIPVKEFLTKSWQKSHLKTTSPNIMRMIERFNLFSSWVAHCLVNENNLKKRGSLLIKFIKLGKECINLNNFNAVFEISSGLQQSAVHRLKKTWEIVKKDKEASKSWDEIFALTSNANSFSLYREKLHTSNPPCLPYLGVYQTDMTFVQEGNPDFIDDQKINFFKRRLVAEVIREIQVYQQTPYNLVNMDTVESWLKAQENTEGMDDDTLFNLSLQIEPRDGSSVLILKDQPNKKREDSPGESRSLPASVSGATGKQYKSKLNKLLGEDFSPQQMTRMSKIDDSPVTSPTVPEAMEKPAPAPVAKPPEPTKQEEAAINDFLSGLDELENFKF